MEKKVAVKRQYWTQDEMLKEFRTVHHVEADYKGRKIYVNFMFATADDGVPLYDKAAIVEEVKMDRKRAQTDKKYMNEKLEEYQKVAQKHIMDTKKQSERMWVMIDKANKEIQSKDEYADLRGQLWRKDVWDAMPDDVKDSIIFLAMNVKQDF